MNTTRQRASASAPPPRRVVVVDRHPLMRRAVSDWINHAADLEVCGGAGSACGAFRLIQQAKPNLVITEVLRPSDLGFVRALHRRHPRLAILVFSELDERCFAGRALEAGARGYLMKGVAGARLLAGAHAALAGGLVLSRTMATRLRRVRPQPPKPADRQFSPRRKRLSD